MLFVGERVFVVGNGERVAWSRRSELVQARGLGGGVTSLNCGSPAAFKSRGVRVVFGLFSGGG